MKARAKSKAKLTLSVGMIVKNEEANLEKCLEALQPLLQAVSSELIIVDTGSIDSTMEIAARYTDKLYQYEWNDDFAAARNATLERASGEWYMYIDADEWLDDCGELIAFFTDRKELEQYNCATFVIRNYTDYSMDEYHDFYAARIVRRMANVKFVSKVHEYLVRYAPCRTLYTFAHHFGYVTNTKDGKKTSRNLPILLDMWESDHDENPAHTCFQIAREYGSQGDLDKSIEFCRKGLELLQPYQKIQRCGLYHDIVMSYFFQGNWDEMLKASDEYLEGREHEYATDIDIRFYRASVYKKKQEPEKALAELDEYFRLLELLDTHKLDVTDRTTSTLFSMEKLYRNASRLDYADLTKTGRPGDALTALDKIDGWVGIDIPQYVAIEATAVTNSHRWGRYAQRYPIISKDREKYLLFLGCIDHLMDHFDEARVEIAEKFAEVEAPDDPYVLGILLRGGVPGASEKLRQAITGLPADEASFELVYYALRDKIDFESYISRIDADDLTPYIAIIGGRENMGDYVSDYYEAYPNPATLGGKRWKCALMEHLLLTADPSFQHHMDNFMSYCATLTELMSEIYGENPADCIFPVIPHAHRFGILMRKAFAAKKAGDLSAYVRILPRAGEAYPYMMLFIRQLLMEQSDSQADKEKREEAELLVRELKDKIQDMIFAGDLENAGEALNAFEKIRPDDEDIEWLRMQLQPAGGELS